MAAARASMLLPVRSQQAEAGKGPPGGNYFETIEDKPDSKPLPGSSAPRGKIFDVLGGRENMVKAVDRFYQKVLADSSLAPYFEGIDMQAQRRKQVMFMSFVFGGPEKYRGRDMWTVHEDMVTNGGLRNVHFDKIKQYLGDTLAELGVAKEVIQQAADVVESTRPEFRFPS